MGRRTGSPWGARRGLRHSCTFHLCASAASPGSSLGTVLPRCSCCCGVPVCCHPHLSFCGPFLSTCWLVNRGRLQTSPNSLELSSTFKVVLVSLHWKGKCKMTNCYEFNILKQICILFTTTASTNFQKNNSYRYVKYSSVYRECSVHTSVMEPQSNSSATGRFGDTNIFRANSPMLPSLKTHFTIIGKLWVITTSSTSKKQS